MRTSLALATALLAGCLDPVPGPRAVPDLGAGAPGHGAQPVYYGETAPTLYPDLPSRMQEAVVALCYRSGQCFCSGSLISPSVVLTAAHCVDQGVYGSSEEMEVHVGRDSSTPIAELPVAETHHGDWLVGYAEDIGVAILESAYRDFPHLHIRRGGLTGLEGQWAQAVGFGVTQDSDQNTQRYWTTIEVVAVAPWGIVVDGHGETGVAPGDSGSPLLFDFGGGPQVVGVASTSMQGWVYSATYTSIERNELWVQSFVDRLDQPECQVACRLVECGLDKGCACGPCPRGYACENGRCLEIAAGDGGVCVPADRARACITPRDCEPGELCHVGSDGRSACGEPCGPRLCARSDPSSYCFPYPQWMGGTVNLCVERDPSPCSEYGGHCVTRDGFPGYCLETRELPLGCYRGCETVVTCPGGSGCVPHDVDCAAACDGVECGGRRGCDCGQCAEGEACVQNRCELVCSAACGDRTCGDDGCGGSCGACAEGERCTAEGSCAVPEQEPDGDEQVGGGGCSALGPQATAGAWALLLWGLLARRPRRGRRAEPTP